MQIDGEIKIVDGIPVMSEEVGYSAEEMVACPKCSKQNPPNRLNCLYCGAALELPSEVAASLQFRPAEIDDWEPGISIVSLERIGPAVMEAVGSTVYLDEELLSSLADADVPIPIIRVRSDEADEVMSRVSAAGASAVLVDDRELQYQQPPTRLKGLGFRDEVVEFFLFNSDEVERISASDVSLIVSGAIFKNSSEATLKKKKKETKHVDEKFDASDHSVIDIYTGGDHRGYRILPHGFDFSCLGESKSLLAVENFKALKELLRTSFANVAFDDSYIAKLPVLDHVWPRTVTNTSRGMQRVGWRLERSVGESVSNEEQFTRYSRMRRELI